MGEYRLVLPFMTSLLDGVKWSASRPGHFISRQTARGTLLVPGSKMMEFYLHSPMRLYCVVLNRLIN
jgi:hypothetical protein